MIRGPYFPMHLYFCYHTVHHIGLLCIFGFLPMECRGLSPRAYLGYCSVSQREQPPIISTSSSNRTLTFPMTLPPRDSPLLLFLHFCSSVAFSSTTWWQYGNDIRQPMGNPEIAPHPRPNEGCDFSIPHVRHNGSTFLITSLIARNFDGSTEDAFESDRQLQSGMLWVTGGLKDAFCADMQGAIAKVLGDQSPPNWVSAQ